MATITPMNQKPAYIEAYDASLAQAKTLTDRQLKKISKSAQLYANQARNIFTDEHLAAVGTVDGYHREYMIRCYQYLEKGKS